MCITRLRGEGAFAILLERGRNLDAIALGERSSWRFPNGRILRQPLF